MDFHLENVFLLISKMFYPNLFLHLLNVPFLLFCFVFSAIITCNVFEFCESSWYIGIDCAKTISFGNISDIRFSVDFRTYSSTVVG